MTVSHLRFSPLAIRAPYLITKANFIGCHQFSFLLQYDVLEYAQNNAVFLLNSSYSHEQVWDHLPQDIQQKMIERHIQFYVIDGHEVARVTGMGGRINTIMQTCFFAISNVLPQKEAIKAIKNSIKKTYEKKGEDVILMNFQAVDHTLEHLHRVLVPESASSRLKRQQPVSSQAPEFVRNVTAVIDQPLW